MSEYTEYSEQTDPSSTIQPESSQTWSNDAAAESSPGEPSVEASYGEDFDQTTNAETTAATEATTVTDPYAYTAESKQDDGNTQFYDAGQDASATTEAG